MKSATRLLLIAAMLLFSSLLVSPAAAQDPQPTPVPPMPIAPPAVPQEMPAVVSPMAAPTYPVLGNHTVQYNEWLYCIGRAYQVSPWAIAAQNGIRWPYAIYPGQVLTIPDARWYNIPAGPTCTAQFTPPPVPTVTPAPTPQPPTCRAYYTVRWGDTLYGIAWRYQTTVWAIAQANHIWNVNLIYPGQVLCIP